MKKRLYQCIALLLPLLLVGCGKKAAPEEDTMNAQNPIATITMEDGGVIKLELYPEIAPNTVKNFIHLANSGFYDGVIFHRVIDGFMIQGGDPEGTGMGGPGYTIEDEFRDDLRFDGEGILAMANTGMPHTGGSQFFITLDKTPWLNGHHTIFGKVKEGMDVVRRIGH